MASMIGVEHAKDLVQEVADVTAVLSLLDCKTSIYRVLDQWRTRLRVLPMGYRGSGTVDCLQPVSAQGLVRAAEQ